MLQKDQIGHPYTCPKKCFRIRFLFIDLGLTGSSTHRMSAKMSMERSHRTYTKRTYFLLMSMLDVLRTLDFDTHGNPIWTSNKDVPWKCFLDDLRLVGVT